MNRFLRGSLCAAVALTSLQAGVGPASAAPATNDGRTPLPLASFYAIAADPAHGHEFITGGPGSTVLVIADASGVVVKTLNGLPGAAGMALSPDGSTLYVGLSQGNGIAAVDTASFATRTVDLGTGLCPNHLAVAAGLVWFGSECEDDFTDTLHSVDPATGQVHAFGGRGVYADELSASPLARPDMLMVSDSGYLSRLRVTGGAAPTVAVAATRQVTTDRIDDMVVTSDGTKVIAAGTDAGHDQVFGTQLLGLVDAYPAARMPNAVALREDGTVAAGSSDQDGDNPDVQMYAPGQTTFSGQYDFGGATSSPNHPAARGLAFGATHLYAVSVDGDTGALSLRVLADNAPSRPPVNTRRLRIAGFDQIVASSRYNRAFATGGKEGNGVIVLGPTGRVIRVLQHLPGASQMVLNRTQTTLYVALATGDAIAAINTRTLTVRKLSAGRATCPSSAAIAGGLVWFSNECYGIGTGSWLGALNPRTRKAVPHVAQMTSQLLYASGSHPRDLIASDAFDYRAGTIKRFRVTAGASPNVRLLNSIIAGPQNQDLALTPDGLHAVIAPPYLDSHAVLKTADMSLAALIASDRSPVATAVRSDGLLANGVALLDDATDIPMPAHQYAIQLRSSALGGPAGHITFPSSVRHDLRPRGLAFLSRNLLSVVRDGSNGFVVTAHRMPALRRLTVTTDQPNYRRGKRTQVVAHLSPAAKGNHRAIRIYVRAVGGRHRRLVAHGKPDLFGNLQTQVRIGRSFIISSVAKTSRGTWTAHARLNLDSAR